MCLRNSWHYTIHNITTYCIKFDTFWSQKLTEKVNTIKSNSIFFFFASLFVFIFRGPNTLNEKLLRRQRVFHTILSSQLKAVLFQFFRILSSTFINAKFSNSSFSLFHFHSRFSSPTHSHSFHLRCRIHCNCSTLSIAFYLCNSMHFAYGFLYAIFQSFLFSFYSKNVAQPNKKRR